MRALFAFCAVLTIAAYAGLPTTAAAAADPGAAAVTVGSTVISMQDVESTAMPRKLQLDAAYESQLRALNQQRDKASAALLERTIEQLVADRLLELEAVAKGSTPERLIADLKPAPVSDADVAAFYAENAARISQPLAEVSPQIRQVLTERALGQSRSDYLAELRTRYPVRALYEPKRFDVSGGRNGRGPDSAPVTIVEFADFECPYCARLAPILDRLIEQHPTQVRHVFRHYPLSTIHPMAHTAAVAAECAAVEGKFWEMHAVLFRDPRSLSREGLVEAATSVGMDRTVFAACLDSPTAKQAVERDLARARDLPIEGTPTIFINGRLYLGGIDYDGLLRYVEEELSRRALRAAATGSAP
jgi:protein-disulfide isomerase